MKLDTLPSLYAAEIHELLGAERLLATAFEKLAVAASHVELCQALVSHAAESTRHAERLASILDESENPPRRRPTSPGAAGLLAEADARIHAAGDAHVRDLAIVGAARRAMHYEIVSYLTVIAWARALGRNEDILLLEATLDEERQSDDWLSRIALAALHAEARVT